MELENILLLQEKQGFTQTLANTFQGAKQAFQNTGKIAQKTHSAQLLDVVNKALKTGQVPINFPDLLQQLENVKDVNTNETHASATAILQNQNQLRQLIQGAQGGNLTDDEIGALQDLKTAFESVKQSLTNNTPGGTT